MDREKVIKGVHDARRYLEDREWVDKSVGVHIDALNDALELIKEQEAEISRVSNEYLALVGKASKKPTVVRCKDCRWGDLSKNIKGEEMIFCYNGDTGIEDGYLHEPEWFCAYGERKDA